MSERIVAKTYRDLIVWQKAMELAEEVYRLSYTLPKHEMYGLASQIQRAAVSIPSNIAEGHARKHKKEFVHHLSFAKGSLAELETQIILAVRLGHFEKSSVVRFWSLSQEVGKMLTPMINSLSRN
jgi:four helix bundle protein